MAIDNVTSPGAAESPEPDSLTDAELEADVSADATYQLRAFLARTRVLSGCDYGSDDDFWNGRGLIEELALARETGTMLSWSPGQCADVIHFIHNIQPTKGNCFCNDDSEISATCGFHVVLEFVEKQLRKEAMEAAEMLHKAVHS